jgi:hypothetical protein
MRVVPLFEKLATSSGPGPRRATMEFLFSIDWYRQRSAAGRRS